MLVSQNMEFVTVQLQMYLELIADITNVFVVLGHRDNAG